MYASRSIEQLIDAIHQLEKYAKKKLGEALRAKITN